MAQLIVRRLEDEVKSRLIRRAESHGRSMEDEVREILRNAVRDENRPAPKLGSRIAARFRKTGLTTELPELRGHPPLARFPQMIVLDTNVLSALMRRKRDSAGSTVKSGCFGRWKLSRKNGERQW